MICCKWLLVITPLALASWDIMGLLASFPAISGSVEAGLFPFPFIFLYCSCCSWPLTKCCCSFFSWSMEARRPDFSAAEVIAAASFLGEFKMPSNMVTGPPPLISSLLGSIDGATSFCLCSKCVRIGDPGGWAGDPGVVEVTNVCVVVTGTVTTLCPG